MGPYFFCCIAAACGEVKSINRSHGQSVSAEQQSDPNFELAGLGDASCQLTYQLVKKVTGMSSASVFYEADSGNLVSRQAGLQTDFGDGCFTYCSAEFQSLKTRYGAERVLLRNCNFARNIATASVKGLIETFADGTLKGFACKYGQAASVDVEIFLGGASGVGVFAGRTTANLSPADEIDRQNLAKQCATTAAVHRFSFVIPEALRTQNQGKAIFVHAIDAAASSKNFAIGDSGKFRVAGLQTTPTYEVEIKAIIASNCLSCHNTTAGAKIAPFLATYEQVKGAFNLVLSTLEAKQMPPPPGSFSATNLVAFKGWRDAAFPLAPTQAPPAALKVVYKGTIDKLLNDNCLSCHKAGMVSPDLSSFEKAKAWAGISLTEMQKGTMPLRNKLPEASLDLFKKWINDGTLLEFTGN